MPYTGNLGLLFYKNYYTVAGNRFFDPRKYSKNDTIQVNNRPKKKNEIVSVNNEALFKFKNGLIESSTPSSTILNLLSIPASISSSYAKLDNEPLTTIYPGLLTGSGYIHETGSMGEYKLGFFFDHTTGLPIIPGSSVKGALRSIFPSFHLKEEKKASQKEKAEFIWRILNNEWDENKRPNEQDELHVFKLELQIFEGVNLEKTEQARIECNQNENREDISSFKWFKEKSNWQYLSIYHRDIFHDAFIISPGKDGKIFGNDYITPHINRDRPELSPFTNPNPIQFLKILPGVTFQFQFKLTEIKIGDITVTREHKKLLFKHILLNLGIGAKTNVGYGQFKETGMQNEIPDNTSNKAVKKFEHADIPATLASIKDLKRHNKKTGEAGTLLFGEIVDITPSQKTITIMLKVKEKLSHIISNIDTSQFEKGDIVQLEYRGLSGPHHQFKLIN